jgi:hypothetical protein
VPQKVLYAEFHHGDCRCTFLTVIEHIGDFERWRQHYPSDEENACYCYEYFGGR